MKLRIDLLRHGATTGGNGFRGALDDPLSELGWSQLRLATSSGGTWSRVVSSPLRRCSAFAAELATERSLPLSLERDLRELGFGDWEGLTAAQLMEQDAEALKRFWEDPYAYTPPRGEAVEQFEARVLGALATLVATYPDEHILLVTHAGVMRLLLANARGLARHRLLEIEVAHASLFGLQARLKGGRLNLEERVCRPS